MKTPKKVKMIYFLFTIFDVNERKKETTATFYVERLKHTNLKYANYTNGLEMLIRKRLSILYEGIE